MPVSPQPRAARPTFSPALRWRALPRAVQSQLVFDAGLFCLLVLSEVFSSNLQASLPAFCRLARLALTGGGVLLLVIKLIFFTPWRGRGEQILAAAVLGYAAFAAWHGSDVWFLLALLVGFAARGVNLHRSLCVYLAVAAAGLIFVQLLSPLGLVRFRWYCRNWDFGYGHYNGYGARLLGLFFAWAWLRWRRVRWFDFVGLTAILAYTWMVPHCRGAAGGMAILLALLAVGRLWRALPFCAANRTGIEPAPLRVLRRVFCALTLAMAPLFAALSMAAGWFYNPADPYRIWWLFSLSHKLSGRFEVWSNHFWTAPFSLLGGLTSNGDEHTAIDNLFLAIWMNKGILGGILVLGGLVFFVWRLQKLRLWPELCCLAAMLCYCLMENKFFLVAANPLLLLIACAVFCEVPCFDSGAHTSHTPKEEREKL